MTELTVQLSEAEHLRQESIRETTRRAPNPSPRGNLAHTIAELRSVTSHVSDAITALASENARLRHELLILRTGPVPFGRSALKEIRSRGDGLAPGTDGGVSPTESQSAPAHFPESRAR